MFKFDKVDYNKITEDIAAAVLAVEEPKNVRDRKKGSIQINLEGRCEKVISAIVAAHVASTDVRRGVYRMDIQGRDPAAIAANLRAAGYVAVCVEF